MVELLMVLVVLAILATAASLAVGNRGGSETRTVLDQMEGTLLNAQQLTAATNQDVTVVAQGNWDPAAATPLSLCRVLGLNPAPAAIAVQANMPETAMVHFTPSNPPALTRECQFAGVTAVLGTGSTWWATAMGTDPATGRTNQDITTVAPFNDPTTGFQGILVPANNLFQGGATQNQVSVSGLSERFTGTFFIQVVGLHGGQPYPGSPMGLLVVQANGATVYKFYNPGTQYGNGQWRRI